eukprot:CAMPEP_0201607564 /NCGR_PEP_ID=MMETSP0492-20130828/6627_1 /ASSEMBLY_ACC=CAM_ASM_000837 /TAXON_ID=420259 /ORGANISM="Thalassiosira gravida, Strain GMp14c1" /LENGTH=202 /DNA_ID=CAMNT_0048072173 /DNA_START=20 /DNA_END=628 /DNA_ORIENTATION=-
MSAESSNGSQPPNTSSSSTIDTNADNNNNTINTSTSTNKLTSHNLASAVTAVENAAELSFGNEFDSDIQILSNAQVAVILQMSAQNALVRDEELHDVYKKTQKYVERFNTMKNPEKEHQELVDELDNLQGALTTFRKETEDGEEMELHGFEVAALMNLVQIDTMVEEAASLIPSLSRFPESAVDEILDLIRNTMIRIVSYGS